MMTTEHYEGTRLSSLAAEALTAKAKEYWGYIVERSMSFVILSCTVKELQKPKCVAGESAVLLTLPSPAKISKVSNAGVQYIEGLSCHVRFIIRTG